MPWIVGGAILGSAVIGSGASAASASSANAAQEHLFRQRHQIEVADLKKAGLNPVLSAMGSGGSVPQSHVADFSGLEKGMSSAAQFVMQKKLTDSQVNLNNAQAIKAAGETLSPGTADKVALANAGQASSSAAKMDVEAANLPAVKEEIFARIDDLRSQIEKRGVDTETARQLQSLTVQLETLKVELARLQLPQARAVANVAEKANALLDKLNSEGPSVSDTVGKAIGGFLSDMAEEIRGIPGEVKKNLGSVFDRPKSNLYKGSHK